jgi:hypothetical protein
MRRLLRFRTAGVTILMVLVVLAGLAGCKPRKYRVVTRIDERGNFEREIFQPLDDSLSPEALSIPKTAPPTTQPTERDLRGEWKRQWRRCEVVKAPEEATPAEYLQAAGVFPTADLIPRTYHLPAYPLEGRAAVNRIEHTFDDYLLFGIDHWSETITETVVLYEYVETIDEIIRQMTPALRAMLDDQLAATYDLSALHDWIADQGAKVYRRWCLWFFENGPVHCLADLSPAAVTSLREALAPSGFELPCDDTGEAIDASRTEPAVEAFTIDLLCRRVRMKDSGELLSREQATTLFKSLTSAGEQATASSPAAASQPASAPAGEAIATRPAIDWEQAETVFKEAFQRANGAEWEPTLTTWQARTGGAHLNDTFPGLVSLVAPTATRQYRWVLEAAGPILDTNGERTGPDQVTWDFGEYDIWPYGYEMHAAAVRWNHEAEKQVFGRAVLESVDAVVELCDILDTHDAVADALARAIELGSTRPLDDLAAKGEAPESAAAARILELGRQRE